MNGVVTIFVQLRIYCMWSIDLFSHNILHLEISSKCGQYPNLVFIGITTTSNTEYVVAGLFLHSKLPANIAREYTKRIYAISPSQG